MNNRNWLKERVAVAAAVALVVGGIFASAGGSAVASPAGAVAEIRDAAGNLHGKIKFNPTDDGKVLVKVSLYGLAPGWHGFHVHSMGMCDPGSAFASASGHFNPTAATHGGHAGDMTPLLVNADGTANSRFETDRFTVGGLSDADGSAVIVHAAPDNLGNVPAGTTAAPRYHSHTETDVNYTFGADNATKATGDAGSRFGCGVVTATND
ncbi:MAG: superoxide dismutase, Cu-Zn family [Actinomycetota bacterium]|jgi:Cu-Zn family superoxide dismutase|nr:superoxide dismutase, Cu-Zn family [Actinomycetota bacterium]